MKWFLILGLCMCTVAASAQTTSELLDRAVFLDKKGLWDDYAVVLSEIAGRGESKQLLIDALNSFEAAKREAAGVALVRMGVFWAVRKALTKEQDIMVQVSWADYLGKAPDPNAVGVLWRLARFGDARIRGSVIRNIGLLNTHESRVALTSLARDTTPTLWPSGALWRLVHTIRTLKLHQTLEDLRIFKRGILAGKYGRNAKSEVLPELDKTLLELRDVRRHTRLVK